MNSSADVVASGASSTAITTSVRLVSGRSHWTSTVPRIMQSHIGGGLDGPLIGARRGEVGEDPGALGTVRTGGCRPGDTIETGMSLRRTGRRFGSSSGCVVARACGVAVLSLERRT